MRDNLPRGSRFVIEFPCAGSRRRSSSSAAGRVRGLRERGSAHGGDDPGGGRRGGDPRHAARRAGRRGLRRARGGERARARSRCSRTQRAAPRRSSTSGCRRSTASSWCSACGRSADPARADHRDLGPRQHRDRGARDPRSAPSTSSRSRSRSTRCCSVVERALGRARSRVAARRRPSTPARPLPSRVAAAPPVPQRTIARSVVVNGQGLHSGVRTGLILQPLPPGSGIVFGSISRGDDGAGARRLRRLDRLRDHALPRRHGRRRPSST